MESQETNDYLNFVFDLFDENRDGVISRVEFYTVCLCFLKRKHLLIHSCSQECLEGNSEEEEEEEEEEYAHLEEQICDAFEAIDTNHVCVLFFILSHSFSFTCRMAFFRSKSSRKPSSFLLLPQTTTTMMMMMG